MNWTVTFRAKVQYSGLTLATMVVDNSKADSKAEVIPVGGSFFMIRE